MAHAQSSVPRRYKRFKLGLILLGVGISVTLSVGFASLRINAASRKSAVAKEVARLHQEGLPVNLPELDRFYHNNAESDRLGKEIVDALNQYDDKLETVDGLLFIDRRGEIDRVASPDDLAHMRTHAGTNQIYFERLDALLNTIHEVRYPMDLSLGYNTEFPWLPKIRNASRMFAIRAQLAVNDGRPADVLISLVDSIRVAETLRQEPTLILQLVRVACHGIAREQVEFAINTFGLRQTDLDKLSEELKFLELNGLSAYGFIGEWCNSDLEAIMTGDFDKSNGARIYAYLPRRFHLIGEIWSANLFLGYMEIVELAQLPPWERHAAAETLELDLMDNFPIFHYAEKIFLPPFVRQYDAENRAIAELETMRTSLAILRAMRESHALFDDLASLAPKYFDAVPLDPFSGKPLGYKRTENGFVVYSVGYDLDDDGGVPPPEGKKILTDGDVVFRVLDARPYLSAN